MAGAAHLRPNYLPLHEAEGSNYTAPCLLQVRLAVNQMHGPP